MKNIFKKELTKVFAPSKKLKRYIVHTETKLEGEIIYGFWKEIDVKILDNPRENYSTSLLDIYYSKTTFKISYYLWHLLMSNEVWLNRSHTYNEFKCAISKSHILYDIFCQIEKEK